jgi:acyl-coenzyme A thioesterase PaaI-like protein
MVAEQCPSEHICIGCWNKFSVRGAAIAEIPLVWKGNKKEKSMVNFIRPLEPEEDVVESRPVAKKKKPRVKDSEEIGFVVRREHRRKHREDRAI